MLKTQIRLDLRKQRLALSQEQCDQAALQVCQLVASLVEFDQATTIAAYSAIENELNPLPILQLAWSLGKTVTLPHVLPNKTLEFFQYTEKSPMITNRYGILEVDATHSHPIPFDQHDIILLPMTAFDANCNRIGMGSGYYDKTIAQFGKNKTILIGIAYDFQCVKSISIDSWDIKMDKIVTETTIYGAK